MNAVGIATQHNELLQNFIVFIKLKSTGSEQDGTDKMVIKKVMRWGVTCKTRKKIFIF